jgi:hypothetical protein
MTQWSRKPLYSQTVMGWQAPQNGLDSALRHDKRGKLGLGSGLPGSWAVLFVRAVVEDPAGCVPPLAQGGEDAVAFR